MPTPNPVNDLTIKNQYGEESICEVKSVSQEMADKTPSNSDVAGLSPIASPSTATAEDVANAYNDLLAALQANN